MHSRPAARSTALLVAAALLGGLLLPALRTAPAKAAEPAVDVVFAVDESGSMSSMSTVKSHLRSMATDLDGSWAGRFGLVGFGSSVNGGAPRTHTALTDRASFDTAVGNLVASGGFEPGLSATTAAVDDAMDFRTHAAACVVVITDEDADDPENLTSTRDALFERGAVWFGAVPLGAGNTATTYGPDPGSLAEATGGAVFGISSFLGDPTELRDALLDGCLGGIQGVVARFLRQLRDLLHGLGRGVTRSDPVDTYTGAFLHSQTDLTLPGSGLPFRLTRSYDSGHEPGSGPLGRGWNHSYGARLAVDGATGDVTFHGEDAHSYRYTLETDGTFTPEAGLRSTLASIAGGYELTRHDQVVYTFDTSGRLVELADPNGNALTLSYDGSGHLDSMVDSVGQTIDFVYAASGLLTSVTGPGGRSASYGYTDGLLTSVTDVRGETTTYTYDGGHRLATIVDPNGNTEISNVYGTDGRVTEQTDALGNVSTLTWDETTKTSTFTDANGNVWTDTYLGNRTVVTLPDGEVTSALIDADLNVVSASGGGTPWLVEYDAAGNPTQVTDSAGGVTTWTYDAGNRPLTVTNPGGETMTYAYDAAGNLTSVTDAAGNTSTFDHDATGLLTSATDAAGNATTYGYDAVGNVTSVTDATGNTSAYGYDAAGNLTSVTDAAGNTSALVHDAAGNLTSSTDGAGNTTAYGYDAAGRLTAQTDADGEVTSYTYNAAGEVATVTNPLAETTSYTYDATGNLVSVTDAAGNTTGYAHDFDRNVTSVTDPAGNTATFEYDPSGNLVTEVDPAGNAATHTYDPLGRRTSTADALGNTATFAYDAAGRLVSETDAEGNATTFGYDAAGRLVSETDAQGNATTFAYDALGQLLSETDAAGNTTTHTYDAAGRVLTTTNPAGDVTAYAYDAGGRVASMTDASGATTTYAYGPTGRIESVTNPAGETTTYGFDALGRIASTADALGNTTSYTYDALGRRTGVTDPNGATTSFAYDAAGLMTSMTDPTGATTTYGYDAAGRLVSRTDANGNTTGYGYDAAGRGIRETSPSGQTWTQSFDAAGRLVQAVSAAGNATPNDPADGLTDYDYDAAGRLVGVSYSDDTTYSIEALEAVLDVTVSESPPNATFAYDATGRRTSMTDGAGTESYSRDPLGQLTAIQRGSSPALAFEYDTASRIVQRTYPDGTVVDYGYTDGRATSITDPGGTTALDYDAAGRLTERRTPNGQVETRSYDDAGRLTRIRTVKGSVVLEDLRYTLDAAGNPTKVESLAGVKTFDYDAAGQLVEVCFASSCTGPTADAIRYTYDGVGNRLTEQRPTGTTTYNYDDADQLVSSSGTGGLGSVDYEYDPDGRLVAEGDTRYAYDAAGQLVAALDGTTVEHYAYDGNGRRRSATTELLGVQDLESTYFTWDPTQTVPQVILERDGESDVLRRYTHGLGLESMTAEGQQLTYHQDRIGSVQHLTDASGDAVTSYDYEPFGTQRAAAADPGAPENRMRFAGEYLDTETGDYHLRARQYDPATGRFTRPDPLDRAVGERYVSTYVYADNQPTVLVDPLGLRAGPQYNTPRVDYGSALSQTQSFVFGSRLGYGQATIGLFIPEDRAGIGVGGVGLYGAGDGRGFMPFAHPSAHRAFVFVDYEMGAGYVQANPSCDPGGNKCDGAMGFSSDFGTLDNFFGRIPGIGKSNKFSVTESSDGTLSFRFQFKNSRYPMVSSSITGTIALTPRSGGNLAVTEHRHDRYPNYEIYQYEDYHAGVGSSYRTLYQFEAGNIWELIDAWPGGQDN